MWKAFVDLHSGENPELALVKYEYYNTRFVTEHNLGFGKPASDTCGLCDAHDAQKTTDSLHYVRHKLFKKLARSQFDVDAKAWENSLTPKTDYLYWVVDLGSVNYVPKVTCGDLFYRRQLSLYPLFIYDMNSHECLIMNWGEHIAERGAAEVISALRAAIDRTEATQV